MLGTAGLLSRSRETDTVLEVILSFSMYCLNDRDFLLRNLQVLKLICFYFHPEQVPKGKSDSHGALGGVLGTYCSRW